MALGHFPRDFGPLVRLTSAHSPSNRARSILAQSGHGSSRCGPAGRMPASTAGEPAPTHSAGRHLCGLTPRAKLSAAGDPGGGGVRTLIMLSLAGADGAAEGARGERLGDHAAAAGGRAVTAGGVGARRRWRIFSTMKARSRATKAAQEQAKGTVPRRRASALRGGGRKAKKGIGPAAYSATRKRRRGQRGRHG